MYKEGIYHKTNLARSGANCYINLYFSALYNIPWKLFRKFFSRSLHSALDLFTLNDFEETKRGGQWALPILNYDILIAIGKQRKNYWKY
jgi:hypothetical protein